MLEHQKILAKIEQLVDQLPYKEVRIKIQMKGQIFTLEKEKQMPIGFAREL